jgi:hypothetical protein
MALSIKSTEVEKLMEALAEMTGESKTEAVRRPPAQPRRGRGDSGLRTGGRVILDTSVIVAIMFVGDDFPRTDIKAA